MQVSAQVGGQLLELRVAEGDRVTAGDVIARLDTRDTELSLQRIRAERQQADAQVRLLRAGARREDIRQAGAQFQAANASFVSGAGAVALIGPLASALVSSQRARSIQSCR